MDDQRPPWVDGLIPRHILAIPPYVPGKPIAELKRELGIPDAVKMASNENPLGPSPLALKALKDHLAQTHIYPESSAPELRAALAQRYGISAESVILGNGSDEIMALVAHVFVDRGCEAVMGNRTFAIYRICTEEFGGIAVRVPLSAHRFDLASMARAVTDRTRIMFLAFPNNPTGTIVSKQEFERFLCDLPSEGLILVIDEAYREFVQTEDCPNGLDYLDAAVPVLVLRTFSKIYGLAGLRIGYGIAKPWLIGLLNRVRPPFNVNSLAQVAAAAALHDTAHIERSRHTTWEGKAYLARELRAIEMAPIPSEANFVTFRAGPAARSVYEALLQEGIIVRHLASFGMDEYIRVTVGADNENRRFIAALKRVSGRPSAADAG